MLKRKRLTISVLVNTYSLARTDKETVIDS